MGNNGKDCTFKWVRKTENAVQRHKNESAFNGAIVVAAPVQSTEKLLNDSVLFLVVITEIELAEKKTLSFTVITDSRNLNEPVCIPNASLLYS